jgi:hypothetical protein
MQGEKRLYEEMVPYRSPVQVGPDPNVASTQDELDYSTLLEVLNQLHLSVSTIDSVHAIDLTEGELTIKEQIAAMKLSKDILTPLLTKIESIVADLSPNSPAAKR